MYIKEVPKLREKLAQNGVNYSDVEFIMKQIKNSKLDEDFKSFSMTAYKSMLKKDLWTVFEKSCQDLGIVLTRRNEPEQ